jgi:hypothetical protein
MIVLTEKRNKYVDNLHFLDSVLWSNHCKHGLKSFVQRKSKKSIERNIKIHFLALVILKYF